MLSDWIISNKESHPKKVVGSIFKEDDKKRVVDLTSGATRYGAESLNYFNYLARRVAIEINKYNEK